MRRIGEPLPEPVPAVETYPEPVPETDEPAPEDNPAKPAKSGKKKD